MRKTMITLLLLFCLLPLLLGSALLLPSQYDETFLGEMKYKYERLKETNGKRIIFIGGSSVPFALKSKLLEETFPEYSVVDFGMYADLGTVVMFEWALCQLHEDDIVILMPEQNEQTLSTLFYAENVWQCADGDLSLVTSLPNERFEALLAAYPSFAGKKWSYFLFGAPKVEGIYARSSFDAYGDIVYEERDYNRMTDGYDKNQLISFSNDVISAEFIDKMNQFATDATALGATIYYRFPPMNEKALTEGAAYQLDEYYQYLSEQLTFPILGNPHKSVMDYEWFYDTNFHLNESGSMIFMQHLIEDFKVLFQDTSITKLELPDKPKIPDTSFVGDDSFLDCFTYEETKNGYRITGVTDLGLTEKHLILPSTYNGASITEISEKVFLNCKSLEEITIQKNIAQLPDGLFSHCNHLSKIHLTSTNPGDYSVGDHFLQGTSALIYVPKEALDAYRRNYQWQGYGQKLVGE